MFVFLSLLAASVDGFISGFLIGGMGIKLSFKDILSSFSIIFLCCITASAAGKYLSQTQLGQYLDIMGVLVMLFLAWTALSGKIQSISHNSKIAAISLSVAADASVVCLYLAMCGYNIWFVSAVSAWLHSGLMAVSAAISHRIIRQDWLVYTKYISAIFFATMAICKIVTL